MGRIPLSPPNPVGQKRRNALGGRCHGHGAAIAATLFAYLFIGRFSCWLVPLADGPCLNGGRVVAARLLDYIVYQGTG